MPVLEVSDIPDLIIATEKNRPKPKFTELGTSLPRYIVSDRLLSKHITEESGKDLSWPIRVATDQTVRSVGLRQVNDIQLKSNTLVEASIPWRRANGHYVIFEDEVAVNREPHRIVDLINGRRSGTLIDWAEFWEQKIWNKPTDSTDQLEPFGFPYWVPKNNAGVASQLNGGNPAGFAAGSGGVSSVTYPRWASGAAGYTTVSKDDLWAKVREFMTRLNFVPPVSVPETGGGRPDWALYTTYRVVGPSERELERQNDSLGNDIASKDGKLIVRGIPVEVSFYLDINDLTDPVYGINWAQFRIVFLRGWYMKTTPPIRNSLNHNAWERHYDCMYNMQCFNRRENFVVSK